MKKAAYLPHSQNSHPGACSYMCLIRIPRRYSVLVVLSALATLCGCSALNLQNLTGSRAKAGTDFTGNYTFSGVAGSSGQAPGPVQVFVGAVANPSGTTFGATLRLVSSNGCVAPSTDVVFTGSMSASGQITLTSTTLPNNPVSITWLDDPAQSSNGVGTYTISGSGPCATPSTQFVSDQYSPVTGTYTGTFTSAAGAQATVTATLSQGTADEHGQFPETGSVTLATSTCTNNFNVGGTVTGPILTLAFNQSGTASLGGFVYLLPDHVLTLQVPSGITVTGSCNPGAYSGVLSKQ